MTENRYAVLVANQTYPDNSGFHSLKCPLNDAKALSEVLLDPDHGAFTKVEILPDLTRSAILERLEEILEDAEKEDLVFIYFSGHGKTDKKGNLFYAAQNTKAHRLRATGINGGDITELIHECNVAKKALVLDCCYAGAIANQFKGGENVAQDRVNEFSKGAGTYVLMATGELSLAAEDPELGLSVLTRYMVDGLRGEADANRDGIITLTELSRYVTKQVIDFHEQKPTEAGLGIQGDVAISKSGFVPEKEFRDKISVQLGVWSHEKSITYRMAADAESVLDKGPDLNDPCDIARRELLGRVVKDDLTSGAFSEAWFQIIVMPPPDPAPPKPEPVVQIKDKDPAAWPKAPPAPKNDPKNDTDTAVVEKPVSPPPVRDPKTPEKPGGLGIRKPGPEDGITLTVGWIVAGFVVAGGAGFLADANRFTLTGDFSESFESGLLVGAPIAAFLCLRRYFAKRHTLGWFAKLICVAGALSFFGFEIWLLSIM